MTGSVVTCPECRRTFDLMDEDDAGEWYYGHDCEPVAVQLPLDRPPRMTRGATGGWTCQDCGHLVILFDDDEHFCEATGTSTTFNTESAPCALAS